jgi:FAD synthase
MPEQVWHTPSTAGRAAGVTAERIRQLCNEGRLKCVRDALGRRLIPEVALRDLLADREKALERRQQGRADSSPRK